MRDKEKLQAIEQHLIKLQDYLNDPTHWYIVIFLITGWFVVILYFFLFLRK